MVEWSGGVKPIPSIHRRHLCKMCCICVKIKVNKLLCRIPKWFLFLKTVLLTTEYWICGLQNDNATANSIHNIVIFYFLFFLAVDVNFYFLFSDIRCFFWTFFSFHFDSHIWIQWSGEIYVHIIGDHYCLESLSIL